MASLKDGGFFPKDSSTTTEEADAFRSTKVVLVDSSSQCNHESFAQGSRGQTSEKQPISAG